MSMPDTSMKSLERYFREPGLPNLLKPGMSGTACCNIRTALSSLGCQREWQNGEMYDAELERVVRDFQTANGHRDCGVKTPDQLEDEPFSAARFEREHGLQNA